MAASLVYYVGDVLGGQIVGDLPFVDVTMDWYLSGRGTFKGKLKLSDPDVISRGGNSIIEAKSTIWVEYNGALIWGGIVWITDYDSSTQELTVTAADFWSFFWRRVAATSITTPDTLSNLAQTIVTNDGLSDHIPANLSVIYTIEPGVAISFATIPYTYNGADRKMVGELLEALGDMDPGYEFRCEVFWANPGVPACQVNICQPRLGNPVTTTGAIFDFPGNVTKYTLSLDASRHAARVYVRGNSTGVETVETIYEDTTLYTTLPRYDDVTAIDEQSVLGLSARGQYLFNARRRKRITFEAKVRPDVFPMLGSYLVGDDCSLTITDPRFPYVYVQTMRIAVISYDVNNQEVTLTPWIDIDA